VLVGHVGAGFGRLAHRGERRIEVVVACLVRRLHPQPEPGHRLVHIADQRPGGTHGEVEARLVERPVRGVDEVVEQVDAAAEGDASVDDAELAVQASPARRHQHAPAARRVVDGPLHAGRLPAAPPIGGDLPGADPVDDDAHAHPARAGALERFGDGEHRARELEDVGLDQDFGARRVDGLAMDANSAAPFLSSVSR
jgi:hypothetical protein